LDRFKVSVHQGRTRNMCRSETKKSSIHWRPSTYEECVACHSHGERLLVPRHRPWRRSACPGRRRGRRSVALARVTPLIGYTKADKRLRYDDVGRPRQRRARLRPPSLRHGGGRRHARGRRWRTMYVRWYSNSMRAPGRIRLKLLGFFPFGGRSAS